MTASASQLRDLATEAAMRAAKAELKRKRILDSHRRGLTARQIAATTGSSITTVRAVLDEAGNTPRMEKARGMR